jgi:hypothetical protein
MTVTQEQAVSTDSHLYRARLTVPDRFHILTFRDTLDDLDQLLWGASFIQELSGHKSPEEREIDNATYFADDVAAQAYVIESTYRNPFDIIFALGVIGAGSLAVGNRLLKLHDRFQQSRLTKARTDLQVTALQTLRDEITEETRYAGQPPVLDRLPEPVSEKVIRAARALAIVERIEQLPPQ